MGSGLKSLSLATSAIVEQARSQIDAAAQKTTGNSGEVETNPSPLIPFTEDDVARDQVDMIRRTGRSFDSITDKKLRDDMGMRLGQIIENTRHAFIPPKSENAKATTFNNFTPDIEEASVDIDTSAGAVDNFHVSLLINLRKEAMQEIRLIRVFRATIDNPVYTRPLATLSMAAMQRISSARGRKNEDSSAFQIRLNDANVPNAISNLNPFDPYTGVRKNSSGPRGLMIPPPLAGSKNQESYASNAVPQSLSHLDKSVLENINVISNIQQNPIYGFMNNSGDQPIQVGVNVNTGMRLGLAQQTQVQNNKSNSSYIIDQSNKLAFQQICSISMDKLKYKRVGDLIEIEIDDSTVMFGKGYKYFAVTVNNDMKQSSRSQVVSVVIEGLRIPERPLSVVQTNDQKSVALNISVGDQLVEKFEVYRKENTVDRKTTTSSTTINDKIGFSSVKYDRTISDNNYLLIGECPNGLKTGGQFIDKEVIPGREYSYRVYSVDIFGNKSESPVEITSYIPDLEQQFVNLKAPSLLSEVDSKTLRVKLSFQCDDPNIRMLQIERRDLTIGQELFTVPTNPPRSILGGTRLKGRKYLEGERMYDKDPEKSWNGVIIPTHGIKQELKDTTAVPDHIYQYRIFGVDAYGNRSSYSITPPMLVVRRAFINEPKSVTVTMDLTQGSENIKISWIDGNIDKPAEDLLGDQNDLEATSVRTLYQVQRLKNGESKWLNFPLMTGTLLIDKMKGVETDTAPNYRPPYPEYNQTYLYRVQAVQVGGFISNFSKQIKVFTGKGMTQPINFKLLTPSVQTRPFYVMLNWDTHSTSGVVDYWEIERAEVNNYAASKLNYNNPAEFKDIVYKPFRKVYLESSRFVSKVMASEKSTNSSVIVGNHHFADTQVDFGNSYFYRIKAVSPEGTSSKWSYKGIKLTSASFEKKWSTLLTDEEKQGLSKTKLALLITRANNTSQKNSLSLQPEYSKPLSKRTSPKIDTKLVRIE
jgi:hypothetical protein